jgi:hypothetical protein
MRYLEMQCDERKDERLQILDDIVKHSQSFRILAVVDICQRADFGRLYVSPVIGKKLRNGSKVDERVIRWVAYPKRDMVLPQLDLQFLFPIFVWLWPFGIVFSAGTLVL